MRFVGDELQVGAGDGGAGWDGDRGEAQPDDLRAGVGHELEVGAAEVDGAGGELFGIIGRRRDTPVDDG